MSDSSVARSQPPSLIVREIEREDADAVAELSGQLGYEASAETIKERIAQLPSHKERQVVFVACLGSEIVGWIEASIMHDLQSPPYSLIGGLVVREERRSLGIGKTLCAEVEAWSSKQGITVIRVTSRLSREGAHKFYLREGFQRIKTWAVFEKMLP
ncbi:MAG: GNAT family N-acetyltransferase [Edaphobacter sp.]